MLEGNMITLIPRNLVNLILINCGGYLLPDTALFSLVITPP